jgi:hypothetical protein
VRRISGRALGSTTVRTPWRGNNSSWDGAGGRAFIETLLLPDGGGASIKPQRLQLGAQLEERGDRHPGRAHRHRSAYAGVQHPGRQDGARSIRRLENDDVLAATMLAIGDSDLLAEERMPLIADDGDFATGRMNGDSR